MSSSLPATTASGTLPTVATLQIDFEEGFAGDTVVIAADGHQLWRGEDLTTNLAISLAAVARIEIPDDAEVEVAVPSRGLAETLRVHAPFLRVELADGKLVLHESEDPPQHL
jgi:hypothetical protein